MWLIGTSILGQIGAAAVLYGAVAAPARCFAGPTKYADGASPPERPGAERAARGWSALGAVVVYLLLVLWGPTHALRVWWGILLLAGLIALGIVALRRQTRAEFPAVPKRPRSRRLHTRAPETAETLDAAAELSRLVRLHDAGTISDEEFAREALRPRR